ncbi:MAG: M23 family metallopeptidase [Chloroflexi bacterium]|nr:M23 family metallopeptidase [Chloroflexota bacterium]
MAGALALVLPIAISALGSAGVPLRPLGGEVAGAAAVAGAQTSPLPVQAWINPASVPARPTDADGPRTMAERIPPAPASLTGYQWPIKAGRVTLPFKAIPGGSRIKDGKLFHDGLDMASFCGAPVGAAHAGIVLAAGRTFDDHVGWIGDLGPYYALLDTKRMWSQLPNVVVIDDGNEYRSVYAHFRDVTVKVGQRVEAGQLIGHEGATGHASGCHVHYGLFSPLDTKTFGVRPNILRALKLPKLQIARIDPLLVLPGGEVALKTRNIAKAIKFAAAESATRAASTAEAASTGSTAGR